MGERSQVWRAPFQGGGRWQYEGGVEISCGPWVGGARKGQRRSGVSARGTIASGRGNSKVVLQLAVDDFAELAKAMCAADREATIVAFSEAIVACLAAQGDIVRPGAGVGAD